MLPLVFLTMQISAVFKYNGSYIRQKNVHVIYSVMRLHMFLKRLKIIVNLLLVLMKISYSKKFQYSIFPFIIMIHVTKKLWQISNFSFQGYTEPLNEIFHILVRKFHFAAFQFNLTLQIGRKMKLGKGLQGHLKSKSANSDWKFKFFLQPVQIQIVT